MLTILDYFSLLGAASGQAVTREGGKMMVSAVFELNQRRSKPEFYLHIKQRALKTLSVPTPRNYISKYKIA